MCPKKTLLKTAGRESSRAVGRHLHGRRADLADERMPLMQFGWGSG